MIEGDTSALMAILLGDQEAEACMKAIEKAGALMISTVTAAEALIVADRRGLREEMHHLLDGIGLDSKPHALHGLPVSRSGGRLR